MGTKLRSSSEWQSIFKEFEQSGMSQVGFCAARKIAYGTFKNHYTKYRAKKSDYKSEIKEQDSRSSEAVFHPFSLSLSSSEQQVEYEIRIGSGKSIIIRGCPDITIVRTLVAALEE